MIPLDVKIVDSKIVDNEILDGEIPAVRETGSCGRVEKNHRAGAAGGGVG
ncbi:hypothetical protein ACFV97_24510 [Streptomyces sp. NPDC059913]